MALTICYRITKEYTEEKTHIIRKQGEEFLAYYTTSNREEAQKEAEAINNGQIKVLCNRQEADIEHKFYFVHKQPTFDELYK